MPDYLEVSNIHPTHGNWVTLAKAEQLSFPTQAVLQAIAQGHLEGWLLSSKPQRFRLPLATVAKGRVEDPRRMLIKVPIEALVDDDALRAHLAERVKIAEIQTTLVDSKGIW